MDNSPDKKNALDIHRMKILLKKSCSCERLHFFIECKTARGAVSSLGTICSLQNVEIIFGWILDN